jgi:DNA helicase II / ATP-dependent DNA helicase PcrA
VRLVLDQDFSFAPGVEVTLVQDVKGLEFDYVVLIDASAAHYPDTDAARRALYVGATRAIHQLWVTVTGTPAAALRPLLEVTG